jgi:hypothetical protein
MVFGLVLYKPLPSRPFSPARWAGHHVGSVLYGLWPRIVQTVVFPPLFSSWAGQDTMLGQFSMFFGLVLFKPLPSHPLSPPRQGRTPCWVNSLRPLASVVLHLPLLHPLPPPPPHVICSQLPPIKRETQAEATVKFGAALGLRQLIYVIFTRS